MKFFQTRNLAKFFLAFASLLCVSYVDTSLNAADANKNPWETGKDFNTYGSIEGEAEFKWTVNKLYSPSLSISAKYKIPELIGCIIVNCEKRAGSNPNNPDDNLNNNILSRKNLTFSIKNNHCISITDKMKLNVCIENPITIPTLGEKPKTDDEKLERKAKLLSALIAQIKTSISFEYALTNVFKVKAEYSVPLVAYFRVGEFAVKCSFDFKYCDISFGYKFKYNAIKKKEEGNKKVQQSADTKPQMIVKVWEANGYVDDDGNAAKKFEHAIAFDISGKFKFAKQFDITNGFAINLKSTAKLGLDMEASKYKEPAAA